MPPAE